MPELRLADKPQLFYVADQRGDDVLCFWGREALLAVPVWGNLDPF